MARINWGLPWATNRIAGRKYAQPRALACPSGSRWTFFCFRASPDLKSIYDWVGCSYKYNERPWHPFTLLPLKGATWEARKRVGFSAPSVTSSFTNQRRHPNGNPAGPTFFWHYARGHALSVTFDRRRTVSFPLRSLPTAMPASSISRRKSNRCSLFHLNLPDWYFHEPAHPVRTLTQLNSHQEWGEIQVSYVWFHSFRAAITFVKPTFSSWAVNLGSLRNSSQNPSNNICSAELC